MPHSKIIDLLPPGYGYVVLTGVGSTFVNAWLAMNVSKARKLHDIKYPTMYSPDNKDFNCVQRAHQNTLESYPQFLFLLMVGGLQYPRLSAAGGGVYLIGRIIYAKGYYSDDIAKRGRGSFGYLGLLVLLGSTITVAVRQLGWCNCTCSK